MKKEYMDEKNMKATGKAGRSKKKKIIIACVAVIAGFAVVNTVVINALLTPHEEMPKGDGPKVICIGDSITFGAGVGVTRLQDAWPYVLGRELEGKYEVLNYGISGATLLSQGDQPYAPDFWETAKDQQAQIYILMLGTNDSKPQNWDAEAYATQLDERVLELKEAAKDTIYLMVPPPAFKQKETDQYAAYSIDGNVIRDEIRDIISECAERNGVGLIDLYALMDGHSEYMSDGVHPNQQGNQVIAEYIASVLDQD